MDSVPWILISIAVALLLIGFFTIVLIKRKGKYHPADYYTFFVMGLVWFPLGIAMNNYVLSIIGLTLMVIGLINKDKWKQNRRSWDKMDKDERKLMMAIIIILGILVLAGLIVFYLFDKGLIQ